LRLVLEELAEALDITMINDPSIDQQVSIRTAEDRPLNRADIWPLIRLLTRDAGVSINQVGNVYNARRVPNSLPPVITTADAIGDSSSARIMQITPLTYVSPSSAIEIIEPLLDNEGTVRQITTNNTLAITAEESVLERINQLLFIIDADPFRNQGIQLYQLSNANATEVAQELLEILQLIEGVNPAYQVKGIERINALLVTAPAARGFDEIGRWVRILDADSQEQVEQLFLYRVRNLTAVELAQTLTNVFEIEDEPEVPETALSPQQEISQQLNLPVVDNSPDSTATPDLAVPPAAPGIQAPASNTAVSANLRVRIVADEATNSLLIRSSARDYRQLLTTINQLDVVPLQVMVNAVIAQITLTDDSSFGVDWTRVAENAGAQPRQITTGFTPDLGGLMFTRTFLDGSARVDATLEAIAINNDVRLLARPSLTVINNQEGEIQIGAEVPVQAGESLGAGGVSTTNIQYRPTGIELYITPQINEDGVVNLIIRQVLSSLGGNGVGGNPIFNNQEISTTVVVRNGENVVLGGLIQTDDQALNTGVPFLNRVPVLGNLFSYQQNITERRELFIVLRPEIINLNERTSVQFSDILERFELATELFEAHQI
ncbi:MAG: secretin N-terminal domain-containing protein, partial [Gammaproteobacteria bacterium]